MLPQAEAGQAQLSAPFWKTKRNVLGPCSLRMNSAQLKWQTQMRNER
jgi:hypothetical protein